MRDPQGPGSAHFAIAREGSEDYVRTEGFQFSVLTFISPNPRLFYCANFCANSMLATTSDILQIKDLAHTSELGLRVP